MVLSTARLLEHWHTGSMTRRSNTLDDLEPEAIVTLNVMDMRRHQIKAGDTIRISTRRGSIEAKVRVDEAVCEGQLFMPFCYSESPVNFLTNPKLDPVGKIPEFKFCAARIERVGDLNSL